MLSLGIEECLPLKYVLLASYVRFRFGKIAVTDRSKSILL